MHGPCVAATRRTDNSARLSPRERWRSSTSSTSTLIFPSHHPLHVSHITAMPEKNVCRYLNKVDSRWRACVTITRYTCILDVTLDPPKRVDYYPNYEIHFYTKVNDNCLCSPLTDIRCAMEPNPYCCMLFQQGTCSLRPIAVPEAPECLLSVRREPAELANLVLHTVEYVLRANTCAY